MKKLIALLMLFVVYNNYSQVGIGTTNPDDGSSLQIDSTTGAFIPPRMTNNQMLNIPTPLEGAMVYNTTTKSHCVFQNNRWTSLKNNTLIINKSYNNGNTALSTPDNTYVNFPIGINDVIVTNTNIFNVTGNGAITINQTGNYLFSASLSTSNMPSGNKKYILALTINNQLVGYLSRGFSSLPNQDYWGTSGNIMYPVNAGDNIKLEYVLNNANTPLSAKFINIGITQLN
ncbi:hypothetical protein [Corallibacter sp.]|uniref:hypothetical protein n=1 Tax=Corallibacter sp. TaxID=2038084 RepID=UPI003A9066C6